MTLRCMDEDEDEILSLNMRGERRTWSGQWLFSPSNTSASVFTRHKNFFFQKYKKKRKLFFSAIFLFGQLIYWFRPSFDNFRSRAGFVQRERKKNNEEWDEKWPCVRFKKIFKKLNRDKKEKMPKQRKSRNTGTVYERSAGRLVAQGQVQMPQINYFDAQR